MSENDELPEWQAAGAAWRGQRVPALDIDALQKEVAHRSRRMGVVRALDLLCGALAVVLCLYAMWQAEDTSERWVDAGLIVVVVAFTTWVHHKRRRQWRSVDLEPAALLAFESARTRTSMQVWRASVWLVCALWSALAAQTLLVLSADAPEPRAVVGLMRSLAANAVVLLVSSSLAWWLSRRGRARLRRLHALEQQLKE